MLWRHLTDQLGDIPFPADFSVCTGQKYFFEIKDGAKMVSVLDRQRARILRRINALQPLAHELAHLYLDMRWKILPYSVSEPFVLAMAEPEKCHLAAAKYTSPESISNAWKDRKSLTRCGLFDLLRAVLLADGAVRDTLPLR